jgi:translation initiation factor 4B
VRKPLALKPRTVAEPSISEQPSATTAPPKSKPNPFGDAKPIDSDGALKRVEERRRQRDKEREEKQSEQLQNGENVVPKQNGDASQ